MKYWLALAAATAAFTAFAPMTNAQVSVQAPGVGVRVGDPPPPKVEERLIQKDVRSNPQCKSVTVQEVAPDGSTRTVTRKQCD
jgi:hypothetical protein